MRSQLAQIVSLQFVILSIVSASSNRVSASSNRVVAVPLQMATAEPEEKSSGAAQPTAKPQSLALLNTRSAKIGMWELYVSNPQVSTYEWTDKKSQEVKSNQVFRCLLVDRNDPANYCVGECKKKPTEGPQPLEAMTKKMKDGLGFRFSKVALAETKQEFISSPKKVVINLAASKLDPILATGGSTPKPVPAMTVAEVLGFNANQRFDMTALVDRVSETPRQAGAARQVFDVFLVDDSKSGDKTLDLKVSLFAAEESVAALRAHMKGFEKSSTAITFFGLQAKKNDKGYSVQSSKDFFSAQASGDRAAVLKEAAATLHSLPPESREIIQASFEGQRDYTCIQGTETFACLLDSMSGTTGIAAIDREATVWQANWAEVSWPTGKDICTSDGARIWFQTLVSDVTGSVSAWCNESTALALSQLRTKEAFVAAHAAGDSLFPSLSSVKLVRKPGDAPQLAGAGSASQLQLVEGMDQSFKIAPAKSTFDLLPLARACSNHSCGIRPACLRNIRQSAQYALAVEEDDSTGGTVLVPCQKVVALVRSCHKSKLEKLGNGFNLVTNGVQDVIPAGAEAATPDQEFTLTTMCTAENLTQYKLDPPRGQKQHALVTITDVAAGLFVVETVQLVSSEDANDLTTSMTTWARLAKELVLGDSGKRSLPWTDVSSPASAKKCRTLGRCPTDPV